MNKDMLAAWRLFNHRAANLKHTPLHLLHEALERLEQSRLDLARLVRASLPEPPKEKSPEDANDYADAPDWATHILEGYPSDDIFVYARWDEEGQGFRGSPHEPCSEHCFFAVLGKEDQHEECEPGWQVVSSRDRVVPISPRAPE